MTIQRQAMLVFLVTFIVAAVFGLVALADMAAQATVPVGVVPSPDPPKEYK